MKFLFSMVGAIIMSTAMLIFIAVALVFVLLMAVIILIASFSKRAEKAVIQDLCDHIYWPISDSLSNSFIGQRCSLCGKLNLFKDSDLIEYNHRKEVNHD